MPAGPGLPGGRGRVRLGRRLPAGCPGLWRDWSPEHCPERGAGSVPWEWDFAPGAFELEVGKEGRKLSPEGVASGGWLGTGLGYTQAVGAWEACPASGGLCSPPGLPGPHCRAQHWSTQASSQRPERGSFGDLTLSMRPVPCGHSTCLALGSFLSHLSGLSWRMQLQVGGSAGEGWPWGGESRVGWARR